MRSRSSEQEDYLLRLIRQAAEALRRLRERLTAHRARAAALRTAAVKLAAGLEPTLGD